MKYISVGVSWIVFYLMIDFYIPQMFVKPIIIAMCLFSLVMIILELLKKVTYGKNIAIVCLLLAAYLYLWLETSIPISAFGNNKLILIVSVILIIVGIIRG